MQFQQIRNATSIITFANKRFLIDPLFAPKDFSAPIPKSLIPNRRWPMVELPFEATKIVENIDALILTHSHVDHFDDFAANALPKDLKAFVQDEYDKNFLQKYGFNNIEILTEDGTVFDDIKLYKTPCLHGNMETAMPYYKMFGFRPDAMGVIFKHENEPTVYLAGDTIWCDFVKNSIDKFAPNAIIINAAAAQLEHSGPIIMGTDDIAKLCQYAPNLTVIASHMDTVGHAALNRKELKEFITAKNISKNFLIPDDGELLYINKMGVENFDLKY